MDREQLKAEVREQVADHLKQFVLRGPEYVDDYVDRLMDRANPKGRADLHPCLTMLVREITLDVAVEGRLQKRTKLREARA